MDILGQSALLVSVASIALGAQVLARNARNKLFLAFSGLCALVSLWALSFFLDRIWSGVGFYGAHLVLNVWLGPAGLAFIRSLVRLQGWGSRRLLHVSVFVSACLTVALAFRLDSDPTFRWVREVRQLVYYAPVPITLQLLQLMWIDRRLRRGIKLLPKLPTVGFGRRNFIYFGGLFVLATSVMDHVPWLPNWLPAIGNLALSVYLFFVSQAITQQRLLNFGALFARFLVLLAVAFLLTGIYLLLVAWVEDSPGLFFLNSFIVSFLLLMVLDPLRQTMAHLSQQLLGKNQLRLQQTLRESQRHLTGIVEPGALFQAILVATEQMIAPTTSALFVLRRDGTQFRRVRVLGEESDPLGPGVAGTTPLREMLASHPLMEYVERLLRKGELPVVLDQVLEGEIDRSASRVQREQLQSLTEGLRALRCNILIPLIATGAAAEPAKILGFLTLRAIAPPEPWGSNWGILSVIYPYYQQAAQTLSNMEVYVRSREKERLATLGEMSAGLAHEIRNPLGAIKGAAQFLDPGGPEAEARGDSKFLRVIIEEVDRLNRVVTQFLDYSKPFAAELRPVDLGTLAHKTVESLRPGLPPGISIEYRAGAGNTQVLAAPEQIQQVLVNLIQNGAKAIERRATATGGARNPASVSLSGRILVEVMADAWDVTATVEDDGTGIRKEHLDKLFIPFFTTSPSGTGLGLSISQKIVEAHRGRIEVMTEEGKFTRFIVVLPTPK